MLETVDIPDYNNTTLTFKSKIFQKMIGMVPKTVIPSLGVYNLTICKEKQFVWFRVAKVGTRSIYTILKEQEFRLDADHTYNRQYIPHVYRDYYKFAFVRNPYDRLVSTWKDKILQINYFGFNEEEYKKMKEFKSFVNWVSQFEIETADSHLRTQHSLIDLNHIDFIGRFERFEEDLSIILKRFNIAYNTIPKINSTSNKQHYSSFYTEELRQQVYDIYEKDFLIFNYDRNIIYE